MDSNYFMYHIRSTFYGYKKSQVDDYVSDLLYKNRLRMFELSFRIIKLEGDREQLELISKGLKRNLMQCSVENLPVEMLAHIIDDRNSRKVTPPTKVIVKKVSTNVKTMKAMKTINGTVENVKQELETLTDKVDNLIAVIEKSNILKEKTEIELNSETSDNDLIIGATSTDDTMDVDDIVNIEEHDKKETNQITKNSAIIAKEAMIHIQQEIASGDGERGKVLNFTRVNAGKPFYVIKQDVIKKQPDSFWGIAVNDYHRSEQDSFRIEADEIFNYVNRISYNSTYNSFFDRRSDSKQDHISVNNDMIAMKEAAATSEMNYDTAKIKLYEDKRRTDQKQVINNLSPAEEDAKYIRQKYIIGKIAGEDLFDRKGNLIIGRNNLITSDKVDYADREGKLSELIISMILPDTE